MPTGSHLGAHFKALQKGRLSTGSLPGVGFVGLGNECDIASNFITLRLYQWSRMYRNGMVFDVLRMDEATLHDVGNLSSLLFCGTPQEPEEA